MEERGEFQTNLIPWDFAFDVFSRWVARTNPGMKSAMSRKKFVQRLHATAEDDSMWNSMRSKDSTLVIADYWVTNVEPLAVQCGLVEWCVSGAPSISGSPSVVARTPRVRGLLRINPGAMPAPAQPTQVVAI